MKQHIRKFAIAAAMALAVSGVAQAKDQDDDDGGKACSISTLHSLYVFAASGFNIVGGVAQPKAIVEVIRFHGDGNLTVPAATVSINGVVTRSPPNGPGNYTIGPDCTGSLQFGPPGPTFDLFVKFKGSEIQMIQTNPNTVFRGTAERASR